MMVYSVSLSQIEAFCLMTAFEDVLYSIKPYIYYAIYSIVNVAFDDLYGIIKL